MNQIPAPRRLLATLGVVLALIGTAAFAASAAPATGPGPAASAAYQDDGDDDDAGGTGSAASGGDRALPNTGAGTTAGTSGAVAFQDDDGDDGAGGATAGAGGYPAQIHVGTCDNLGPDPLSSLNDLTLRSDDDDDRPGTASFVGDANAVSVIFSSTEVGVGVDALVQQAHAVVVRQRAGNPDAVVACGEIGGFFVDADDLPFGLHEQNGSGATGIAIVEDEDDDDQVEVRLYLASPDVATGQAAGAGTATGGQAASGTAGAGNDDDGDDGDD